MAKPRSCDIFVVLPPLTGHGIIFGKNSDRPAGEVQEVVYFPAATPPDTITCTYIDVESAGDTKAVILSKPGWMWGAEMGANECGVVIGNEAVWTRDNDDDSDMTVKRLLGMDLVRLGLERSSTADEALEVICELLERYGQGGPCSDLNGAFYYHNSFLIADSTSAWVLETSGKHWVAEHITSGFRNISNLLTITTKIDKKSEGILDYAISKGFWNGEGEFNFTEAFSDSASGDCGRYHGGKNLLKDFTRKQKFGETDMFSILRDKESDICSSTDNGFPTQGSQVSVLSTSRPCVHWFTATPDPSRSVYKPFVFTSGAVVSKHTCCSEKQPNKPHTLYALHEKAEKHKNVGELLRTMEEDCVEELRQLLNRLGDNPSEDSLTELDELFKDCVETEVKFYR